jgi:hypothetical protein
VKRFLCLVAVVCAAVVGAGLSVAVVSAGSNVEAAPSPIRVLDSCACGGSWPQLVGVTYGLCTWDNGPWASPRYTTRPC